MKKYNYKTLKLVFAIAILFVVVFLFYYSCHPYSEFNKGAFVSVDNLVSRIYIDESNLFGVEFKSKEKIRELYFQVDDEIGLTLIGEANVMFTLDKGKILINNQIQFVIYGENYLYRNSDHSLLERIY